MALTTSPGRGTTFYPHLRGQCHEYPQNLGSWVAKMVKKCFDVGALESDTQVHIQPLPSAGCVTLDKLLHVLEPWWDYQKNRDSRAAWLSGFCAMWVTEHTLFGSALDTSASGVVTCPVIRKPGGRWGNDCCKTFRDLWPAWLMESLPGGELGKP